MDLVSLIGPAEWNEFRTAFERRATVTHIATDAPRRFQGLWADWDLDASCRFTSVTRHPHFRALSRGKQVPVAAFTDRMGAFREEAFRQIRAAGASVAFSHFENFSNIALALTRTLEAEFHLPVQINVYITPGGNQGLGVHVDPHDVLILQIQGQKDWDIYDAAGVKSEMTLQTGGWLFVPKGTRHEVRNRGVETSVHFTIGFHPLTWGEVFQRALQQARVDNPTLNERLIVGANLQATPDQVRERLGALLPFVDLAQCAADYYRDFSQLSVAVPTSEAITRQELERLTEASRLRWSSGTEFARPVNGLPELMRGYRRHPLQLAHDWAEPVAWMQRTGEFTPAQLPTANVADAVLLCRFLAGLGVLEYAAP
ncbi:MAG: hypothetical protein HZA32_16610 [Opitutae bacterium]|nr:hypothetical protein [Opitutae bacterium]